MQKSNYFLLAASVALLGIQSCKKDDHDDHNHDENELITTVKISLTPVSGPTVSAKWKDLTPNEPSGQMVDTLKLDSGLVYTGKVELLDETKTPSDDISAEVKKEAENSKSIAGKDVLIPFSYRFTFFKLRMSLTFSSVAAIVLSCILLVSNIFLFWKVRGTPFVLFSHPSVFLRACLIWRCC
jgi:hypothetical protein